MDMAGVKGLITATQQTVRMSIARNAIQSSFSSLRHRRHFSVTQTVCQQSAAAKKADDVEDVPPPQPREPDQRITMAARYQREARTSTGKRREPLGFIATAKHSADAVAPLQTSSTSATSPLIQTNRNPSEAFLSENANNPDLDFLKKPTQSSASRQQPSKRFDSGTSSDSYSSITELLRNVTDTAAAVPQKSRTPKIDIERMLIPGQPSRPEAYDPNFPNVAIKVKAPDTAPPTFRISPSLGRTVAVDAAKNVDIARAFRMVEMKCAANSVKNDLYKQKFHERPGLRRKRLVMSRWRVRFKEAFKATVRRVQDMRRKGW